MKSHTNVYNVTLDITVCLWASYWCDMSLFIYSTWTSNVSCGMFSCLCLILIDIHFWCMVPKPHMWMMHCVCNLTFVWGCLLNLSCLNAHWVTWYSSFELSSIPGILICATINDIKQLNTQEGYHQWQIRISTIKLFSSVWLEVDSIWWF